MFVKNFYELPAILFTHCFLTNLRFYKSLKYIFKNKYKTSILNLCKIIIKKCCANRVTWHFLDNFVHTKKKKNTPLFHKKAFCKKLAMIYINTAYKNLHLNRFFLTFETLSKSFTKHLMKLFITFLRN